MKKLWSVLIAGAVLAVGVVAQSSTLQYKPSDRYGAYLVGAEGRTLYIFLKDQPGPNPQSACTGACLQAWPPVYWNSNTLPSGFPGSFGIYNRPEGRQLTYNGWPLYYYAADQAAGEYKGQGVGNAGYIANLAPTAYFYDHPQYGKVLAGPHGLTLYRFDRDQRGVSNCSGNCLTQWPPLLVSHLPIGVKNLGGEWGTLTRDDGRIQVTYNGWPLYYYAADKNPGEAYGQGVGNVWWVIKANNYGY
ncbi:MAG: hypothetical protein C4342_04620 [Armatimonadota bacterium]|mgnify:CR=1 FL=1